MNWICPRRHDWRAILAGAAAICAAANAAQAQTPQTPQTPSAPPAMPSSIDLLSPMSQEASGTAWLPSSSPMYGKMLMRPNGNMLMLHGAVTPRYTDVGSKRGADKIDAPNWFMGMYSHPLDSREQLGVRAMLSLDPLTEGGYGYPLLFQTGETWHGQPLHDRQHPHDLVSELSATYSRLLTAKTSGYLYLGYPGEPALGPPTFMHRLIAYDLPDAPIGHHWQDATHITWGVATAGLDFGNRWKAEASVFNGREPDENRYAPDRLRLDSHSGRLSYNPSANHSFQVSYGYQKDAEGDGVNQHRITASWLYNTPLPSDGGDANLSTTLAWGQNVLADAEGRSNSVLAEADYQAGRHTYFTRLETIQKPGHELVLPDPALADDKFRVGAYTVGYLYDLTHGCGVDAGVGATFTLNTKPGNLDPFYGDETPAGFQILFRLRPSKERMGSGGMGMSAGDTPSASGLHIEAVLAPAAPTAGQSETLTVTVTDAASKPVTGAKVEAAVEMTSMDMGTRRVAFRETGEGRYVAEVGFTMAGPWRIVVSVMLPGGGKPVVKSVEVTVGRVP